MEIVKGIPASPGSAEGTAKIIMSLDDVGKFEPGDVLVTQATSPAWTPLIACANAVVTDIGGTLSHAAIVCREYGIPAVVGTTNGTQLIKNGQVIEVDGATGVIKSMIE